MACRRTRTQPRGRRGRRGGFSLLETVVALFLLVTASVFCVKMFQLALRSQGAATDHARLLAACRARIDEIRAWAWEQAPDGGYRFNAPWPTGQPDGLTRDGAAEVGTPGSEVAAAAPFAAAPAPLDAEVEVRAVAWNHVVHSPARGLEGSLAMKASMKMVKVTATMVQSSETGRLGRKSLSLLAFVPEPPRRIQTFEITGAGTLDPDGTAALTVQAKDAGGRAIPDLRYAWSVDPIDGNGELVEDAADSSRATFRNSMVFPNGIRYATGGSCRIRVRARCDGREAWNPGNGASATVLDLGSRPPVPVP